jgi:hypothetical protein
MAEVIYTGYFVNDIQGLLRKVPVALTGSTVKVHAHHLTKEFRPANGISGLSLGSTKTLYAYGQAITDHIQAILIRDEEESLSTNRFPHITIATVNGTPPSESNSAIEKAVAEHTVIIFPEPIPISVTEGYFDGNLIHTD